MENWQGIVKVVGCSMKQSKAHAYDSHWYLRHDIFAIVVILCALKHDLIPTALNFNATVVNSIYLSVIYEFLIRSLE